MQFLAAGKLPRLATKGSGRNKAPLPYAVGCHDTEQLPQLLHPNLVGLPRLALNEDIRTLGAFGIKPDVHAPVGTFTGNFDSESQGLKVLATHHLEALPLQRVEQFQAQTADINGGILGTANRSRLPGLLKIRAAMDWTGAEHGTSHYIHGTKGGRASEYYSMAKLMPTKAQRNEYFGLALTDIDDALRFVSGNVSGFLAIRGHVYCEQGRLAEALRDFEVVRGIRESQGDAGGVGEALADLGLVHLRLGHFRQARTLLRAGTEMLEGARRYEFVIRAKKTLALSYLQTLHFYRAFRELCEAYDKAQERQVFGQITPLMELVHDFGCKVGAWKGIARP